MVPPCSSAGVCSRSGRVEATWRLKRTSRTPAPPPLFSSPFYVPIASAVHPVELNIFCRARAIAAADRYAAAGEQFARPATTRRIQTSAQAAESTSHARSMGWQYTVRCISAHDMAWLQAVEARAGRTAAAAVGNHLIVQKHC